MCRLVTDVRKSLLDPKIYETLQVLVGLSERGTRLLFTRKHIACLHCSPLVLCDGVVFIIQFTWT